MTHFYQSTSHIVLLLQLTLSIFLNEINQKPSITEWKVPWITFQKPRLSEFWLCLSLVMWPMMSSQLYEALPHSLKWKYTPQMIVEIKGDTHERYYNRDIKIINVFDLYFFLRTVPYKKTWLAELKWIELQ